MHSYFADLHGVLFTAFLASMWVVGGTEVVRVQCLMTLAVASRGLLTGAMGPGLLLCCIKTNKMVQLIEPTGSSMSAFFAKSAMIRGLPAAWA